MGARRGNPVLTFTAQAAPMIHVWRIFDRPDPEAPDRRQGYVLASSESEALALAGNSGLVAVAAPGKAWPGYPGERVFWSN